jgi:hypothetical protein
MGLNYFNFMFIIFFELTYIQQTLKQITKILPFLKIYHNRSF